MFKSFFIFILLVSSLYAQEENETQQLLPAMKTTGTYMLKASYLQFTTPGGLGLLGAGAASTIWVYQHDKDWSPKIRSKELPKVIDVIGDGGVFFNFPFAMIGGWYWGRRQNNSKFQYFVMEYAATVYLTLAESGLLSFISIKRRPSEEGLSTWETGFRGDSSWPSGHVVPYSALFFKTLHYYGPWWSLAPLMLTAASGYQRMQDGKHWPSDIIGAFFLSGMSSEGVRIAAGKDLSHPFYKWAFEHQFHMSLLRHRNAWGPSISFSY
jgi:membrane-associated phospholipid phosphatase